MRSTPEDIHSEIISKGNSAKGGCPKNIIPEEVIPGKVIPEEGSPVSCITRGGYPKGGDFRESDPEASIPEEGDGGGFGRDSQMVTWDSQVGLLDILNLGSCGFRVAARVSGYICSSLGWNDESRK